MNDIEIK